MPSEPDHELPEQEPEEDYPVPTIDLPPEIKKKIPEKKVIKPPTPPKIETPVKKPDTPKVVPPPIPPPKIEEPKIYVPPTPPPYVPPKPIYVPKLEQPKIEFHPEPKIEVET